MTVAVFITSFNQKTTLIEAIESVLAQTLPPDQIIVVDDASRDGSPDVIRGYQARYPERITAVFHAENQGVAQTRRDALAAVTCDYVTYVDGDDRFLPRKLERELAALQAQPEAAIAFSNSTYITADGRRTHSWVTGTPPPQGEVFVETLTRRYPRGNLFRMELVPTAVWRAAGFHRTDLPVLEDWEMRIRLTKLARTVYVPETLSEIRVHRQGLSSAAAAVKLAAFDTIWRASQPLLADLPPATQTAVARQMRCLRAGFVRQQAKTRLGAYGEVARPDRAAALADYRAAWRDCPQLDWDLLAGLVLPNRVYGALRRRLRARYGQGDGR